MLSSLTFISNLLDLSTQQQQGDLFTEQSISLDLLVWLASINLCGPQIGSQNTQTGLLQVVGAKVKDLIQYCMLAADRSTAHKCARLLVTCME